MQQCLLLGAADPAFQVSSAHPLTLAHGGQGVACLFQCEGKPLFLKQHSEQPRLLGDLRQQFDGDVHISQPLGFREHAAEKNGAFAPGTAAEVFPLSFGKLVLLRRRWQRLRHGM
jgi:hypothetical protein